MQHKILFQETQKFTQWWLWAIMVLPFFFVLSKVVSPLFSEAMNAFDNFSFSFVAPKGFWVAVFIWVLTIAFIYFSKLKTVLTEKELFVSHLLFVKKRFTVLDIVKASYVSYPFVGYGIRLSATYGTVYNVKGNEGVAITLQNGDTYVVGSQNAARLETEIKKLLVQA